MEIKLDAQKGIDIAHIFPNTCSVTTIYIPTNNISWSCLVHGLHSNAHGPLNVRIDQVVKKGDDYNHQKVIDAWHQVCGESAEPDYSDRKYNYCKHLEHTSYHILCIKKHNVCSSACCHSLGVISCHWWLCCWFLYSFSSSTCFGRRWVFRKWWT